MRVKTKVKAGGGVNNHNQTMARDAKALWIKTVLVRLCVSAMAVTGFLALSSPALCGDAYMYQAENGSVWVFFKAAPGEANKVRISIDSPTSVTIRDGGATMWAHWGWGGRYGCGTPEISDPGGVFPATCTHPSGIDAVGVLLGDRDDSLSLDPSTSSLPVGVLGEAGNDEIDLRNGSGGDIIVCGGDIDWAFRDPGDAQATDCETRSLGRVLTSGPAVASWGAGRLDVFWRGTSNELRHRWSDGGGSGEEPLGGQLTSDPAAVSWGADRIDVFWRGTGNDLRHTWYDGRIWREESLGGYLTSGPAVASWGEGQLDVFVRGSGNLLYERVFNGGEWSGWKAFYDGELTSDPAAVSWGWGRVDVFVRGTDGALYRKVCEGRCSDDGWERVEGQLVGAPAVASRGWGMLDVFVLGTDGVLYRRVFANGDWSDRWEPLGGRGHLASDPAVVAWSSGRLDVFIRGTDNALWQLWLLP